MANAFFSGPTIDDVMHAVINAIMKHGHRSNPSRGENTELIGVLLEITNPRARLSRTETRGKPFSCLGELCWYLAGTNDLKFITYYIPKYRAEAEGNKIFGGYGPRLFRRRNINQVDNVITLLRRNPESRRAVIQLFDAADISKCHREIPCTCTLQFLIRQEKLHMFTNMRSNDAFLGLPHDVFSFTMLQEIMAMTLSVGLGTYKHAVGSIHLYDAKKEEAQQFLDEGWQPTDAPMPAMPEENPWPSIRKLLEAESVIRAGDMPAPEFFETLDSYWADLIRLLEVFWFREANNPSKIREIHGRMSSDVYSTFIKKAEGLALNRVGDGQ